MQNDYSVHQGNTYATGKSPVKKFLVLKVFEEDDLDFSEEWQTILWNVQTEEVVMEGDYYHNKIDYQIRGFFQALDYMGIEYEKIEEKTHDNAYFRRFTQ